MAVMSTSLLDQCIDQAVSLPTKTCTNENPLVPDYNSFTTHISHVESSESTDVFDETAPAKRTASPYPMRLNECPPVINSVSELIGSTPLLRLHKIEKEYELTNVELFAKLEYLSPGGSVKDRIGRRMIELHEKEMKPGDYVVEATSGNTGIGLAVMCAIRGYNLVIVMPKKMSMEKENVLTSLGARVIRTRSSAAWNDTDSHIAIAYRLRDLLNSVSAQNGGAKAFCFDQYLSLGNIEAHFNETAVEIMNQMDHKLDYFIATVGTGGTFTGASLRLKQDLPSVQCIAVDPAGSILHKPQGTFDLATDIKPYEVEGIGYDFHPATWQHGSADGFEIVNDDESFTAARKLISLEGILCGGSSGTALAGAVKKIKKVMRKDGPPLRVAIILPDGIRNYLTKFASDDWMLAHSLFSDYKQHGFNKTLPSCNPCHTFPTETALKVMSDCSVVQAYRSLKNERKSHVAVICTRTGNLLCLMSDTDIEYEILKHQQDTKMNEYVHKNALYFVNECSPDLTNEVHCVLKAQYAEGKIHKPAVIVTPKDRSYTEKVGTARRDYYVELDWRNYDVNIITSAVLINTHLMK